MTQSVHPLTFWALNFWKIKFVHTVCHFLLGRRILFHKVIQVWEWPSNFISRYDWIQFIWKWMDLLKWRKPSNHPFMGALSRLSLKMNHFSTWSNPSDTSFGSALSYICLQNESIFLNDANRPTIHSWALYRDFQHLNFCIFFQIWCSLEKQKYEFVLTRGKRYVFLDNQNMKNIHDS